MEGNYRHVSYKERCQLDALKKEGLSLSEIARLLARSKSTISLSMTNENCALLGGSRPGFRGLHPPLR